MTDQKRDESRDIQIICRDHVPCDDYAGHWYSLKVTPKMLPIAPGDTLDRFVPRSDLVAAEERGASGVMVELDACAKALEVVKLKRDERITTERAILDDVKAWASEEINELRSLLQDTERAHSSCAFYFEIEHNRADMFLRAVGELKRWKETAEQTIAEQKARIEELEKRVFDLLEEMR